MASLITPQFERYIAEQTIAQGHVVFDEFIFANIPGLNENNLAQHLTMPTSAQIVHRQAISQNGVINENAVVYSVTIGTEVGDFDFNFIGLINKSKNLLAVAVQTAPVRKTRNKNAVQGNSITRNILLEFSGAKSLTGINVSAETWQIDFTVRLHGIDEKIRLTNRDLYGRAVFFDDGFLVQRKTGNQFTIKPGLAYVEGVRMNLTALHTITANNLPCSIYADVVHHCTVTGAYETEIKYLTQSKDDYVDTANRQHYVQILADIDRNGNVTDRRLLSPFLGITPKDLDDTTVNKVDKTGHTHKLPIASLVKRGIAKLYSGYDSDSEEMAATPKAIKGLKALIDAVTRNLGNYIPNSKKSNATNSASGDTVATSAAVKYANDNANGRVSKSGDTMTGDLSIKSGEYSKLKLYNASGKEFRFESTPDTHESLGKVSYRSADGATEYYAQFFPKKSGTFALTNEVLLNSGIQSIHGVLIAENVGSAWANYQWGAKQGKWRLEVHPDSHTAGNRRFNMVWSPNSGNPTYLSFPHIGDNGETVAYQSWIGQNYVKKSGDTMTGNLTINNGEPRLHGKRGGNNSWYVGLPNGTSDSLYLHSYASNTSLSLESDKINTTKPVFSAGNRTAVSLNGHNIQFRWNNNGNLDLKVDNTELGNIHYTKKAYVYTTADNYGGIVIDRPSKNDRMLVESNGNKFAFIRRNLQTGSNHYAISTPEKSGTMALVEDFTNPTFTLTNWANNGSSLNNITGTKFLSFGDEAIRGLGLPTGADWVGMQIADQTGQKTQIISGGYDNHYIRTNDDLSKNIWHSERLLTDVTLQRLVNRRDYSRTIKGTNDWDNGKQKDIAISGQVITYPDGRIQQILHLKHFRMAWFVAEDHNIGYNQGDRGTEIFLQLWSAMPNRIVNIQAIASRSTNANTSAAFYNEAGEYIFGWNLRKQGNNKDRIWINAARARGGQDEHVDLYVVVEGY